PLRAEAEVAVVLLERAEVEAHEPAREPRAQRGPLAVLEEEPETIVDEVPEEAELFLRQLRVVVRRPKHGSSPYGSTQRAQRAAENAEHVEEASVGCSDPSIPLRSLRPPRSLRSLR